MSQKIKDCIETFHSTGLYIPTRTIVITGEINEVLYDKVIKNIHALDATSGLINIKLNSPGGDLIQGRAIYSAIANCKNYTRITVYGEASSCASIILQAGSQRIMDENSYMMLHIGHGQSADPESHPRNKENWDKFDKYLEKWMEDVYLKKIRKKKKRYTRNQLKSMLNFDTILHPKEALELGLIDSIGEEQ